MAQAGYTPISLYYSTTASAAPDASNLVAGELALNTLDEKLYFKNSAGTVKLLASVASTSNVSSISFGSTGLTPNTATTGVVTVAGTLAVGNGGTGITSFGTGVAGALGQNVSGSGSIALTTSPVFTTPNLGTPTAVTLTSATGLPLSTGVTGTLAIGNGGTGSTSTTYCSLTTNVTGTLPVANGGTGVASATAYALLAGGTTTTGPFQSIASVGTAGQVLTSNGAGALPTFQAAGGGVTTISFGSTGLTPSTATSGAVSVAGTLGATNGGTGQSSYAVGDLLFASTTTALSKLADVATGNALISGGVGVAPSYGKIGLTTHVSGTLPVANGGTGSTTITLNSVMLGNGTSALSSNLVAPGSNGNVLTSNGSTWTSAAPAGGGVTSLNGQTGAVVNTTVDAIGSYGGLINALSADTAIGATIAGSNLRYNTTGASGGGGQSWFSYSHRTTNNASYPGGGTSLSGTWRRMPSGTTYALFAVTTNAKGDTFRNWYGGFFVRIS
jgi:hypothetical protein